MDKLNNFFHSFWHGEGGANKALRMAIPLILNASCFTIMQFVDRKFLLIYSKETFAAASPAGMVAFAFLSLFFGTSFYINVFVAQYSGAGLNKYIGKSLWQGIYFAFFSWLILLPTCYLAPFIFSFGGHEKLVQEYETIYFQILTIGSILVLLNTVLSCFFSGRGKTFTVLWVRFIAIIINIPLDYAFIFGKWGVPEMGIKGAAYATVISTSISTILYSLLIFTKHNNQLFHTLKAKRFDLIIFKKLLKYGLPNGIQFSISIASFAFFLLMLGRLGSNALAASNAGWSLNLLAFIPMVGFATAVSTIVGQEIGKKRIHIAKLATRNIFIMVITYMSTLAILFVTIPKTLLWLLFSGAPTENIKSIIDLSIVILRFIAIYLIFDSINLVYCSAIKAAGDTRFVMWVSFIASIFILIIPSYIFTVIIPIKVTWLWCLAAAYTAIVAIIFYFRYKSGIWEKMNIINEQMNG